MCPLRTGILYGFARRCTGGKPRLAGSHTSPYDTSTHSRKTSKGHAGVPGLLEALAVKLAQGYKAT